LIRSDKTFSENKVDCRPVTLLEENKCNPSNCIRFSSDRLFSYLHLAMEVQMCVRVLRSVFSLFLSYLSARVHKVTRDNLKNTTIENVGGGGQASALLGSESYWRIWWNQSLDDSSIKNTVINKYSDRVLKSSAGQTFISRLSALNSSDQEKLIRISNSFVSQWKKSLESHEETWAIRLSIFILVNYFHDNISLK
jgi:hypothetical protein